MSFTTPLDRLKLLTQPDTSADIIRPRKLGTVNCINVARLGEPITLRYFGASAVCAATGQAHATQEAAEADVLAWADGKAVGYEQQAVVPLGCQASGIKATADDAITYLTWRQLRSRLNSFIAPADNQILDEPALFTLLDPYGNETAYPVQLLNDTWHPADTPSTLHYNQDGEYSRFQPDEYTEGETPLRKLPPGALLLHYSEMEEDGDEQLAYLSTPNPHTLLPAPVPEPVPSPAPLFE